MSLLSDFLIHTLHGIQFGLLLFLISSGMAIILGVLNILNMAHGEFYTLGAFIGYSVLGIGSGIVSELFGASGAVITILLLLVSVIVTAIVMVPVGWSIEKLFISRIYDRPDMHQLVVTFGLLLILYDVAGAFWTSSGVLRRNQVYSGINDLRLIENIIGISYPTYNFLIIILGAVVMVALFWFLNRTKTGTLIRAMASQREMATAMGVNATRMYALVFALGAALAALAGAVIVPQIGAVVGMGTTPLVLSFVIIVIGGLGSIRGAFVGAMAVGILSRWAIWQYPPAELAAPFAIMIAILLLKPEGIYGTWGEAS